MKWILLALVALLIAYVFDMGLLVYAIYAFAGILLVSRYISSRWLDNIVATRICDALTIEEGDRVSIIIEIENRGRLPVSWLLCEDLLPPSIRIATAPSMVLSGKNLEVVKLGRGEKRKLVYQVLAKRRGYYQLGPLVLETGDLFGLHRRYRVASEPNFLLVLPKTITLDGYDIASRRPIGEVVMTYRLFEDPTRIAGVREYQQGDPLSRINWRATARSGILHSKVYEPSTVAGATILLDFDKRSYEPKHEPFRSEIAVTATASIANALFEMGQQVGLVTNGRDAADRIRAEGWKGDARTRNEAQQQAVSQVRSEQVEPVIIPTRKSAEQMIQIRRALGRLELSDKLNFAQLVSEAAEELPRDATIIAVLAKIDVERAVTLGALRRQGYAVTAIINCFDPEDFARLSGPLVNEGIEVRHLRDTESIRQICRRQALLTM